MDNTIEPRKIGVISDGVVIDHIDAGKAIGIYKALNLSKVDALIVIAKNLKSKKQGKKDLIKIENKELTEDELNKIAIISEHATINIIKNNIVTKKWIVKMPEMIERIIICNNPNCITNVEPIQTKFKVIDNNTRFKCNYCEKIQSKAQIKY
jgi:aspartate carbamoyltransferase regulatory subunit